MRAIDMSETRSYPRRLPTEAGDIEFRLMTRADEAAVLDFAEALPRDHVKNAEVKSTTLSCLGTMWRRSGHSWRLIAFREPFRLPDKLAGWFLGQIIRAKCPLIPMITNS
jgi:hypothetical protein